MFFEYGDLHHPWSAKDDFKKEFGRPVYNEYEEECLQNIPDEPAIEVKPADERNQDAMQSQQVETGKDDRGIGGDSLPLCYASFEIRRHMIKASKQKQKETEMAQTRSLCKKEEDKKNQLGDSSYATNILEIYSKGTSYEDGCSSLRINTFSDILPSVEPPHTGGICLLSSTRKAGDFPLETHQALVAEI